MYLRDVRSPSSLGYFRPNQAVNRMIYSGRVSLAGLGRAPEGLGQGMSVDPMLLIGGIGVLALAMFMLGGKGGGARGRKRARLERKRTRISREIAALGAA